MTIYGSSPPANEVCEGYVFTRVCLSTWGGIPACIAGGIPACLAAGLQGVSSQHALQVSKPTPRGEVEGLARGWFLGPYPSRKLRGLGGSPVPHQEGSPGPHPGVPRPTPRGSPGPYPGGLQANTQGVFRPTTRGVSSPMPGGVSQHALRQTPQWLLLHVVRILLECILVKHEMTLLHSNVSLVMRHYFIY